MNIITLFFKKRWGKIVVWTMIVGLLINIVGRVIPIYFVDIKFAGAFRGFVLYLTIASVCIATFRSCYRADDENWRSSAAIAIFVSFMTYSVLGFIAFFDGFSSFTDTKVIYIKGDNSNIKIIEQYVDSGALGGGRRTIVRRDFASFLKYEKIIDTNAINKKEWIKL